MAATACVAVRFSTRHGLAFRSGAVSVAGSPWHRSIADGHHLAEMPPFNLRYPVAFKT